MQMVSDEWSIDKRNKNEKKCQLFGKSDFKQAKKNNLLSGIVFAIQGL